MPAHTREPSVKRDTRPPLATRQNDSGCVAISTHLCVVWPLEAGQSQDGRSTTTALDAQGMGSLKTTTRSPTPLDANHTAADTMKSWPPGPAHSKTRRALSGGGQHKAQQSKGGSGAEPVNHKQTATASMATLLPYGCSWFRPALGPHP